ncbi:uncharacterized protein PFL1_03431 [Pseudozyma flocculosa PF-1]|uniref:Uncharacterized protein n=2 Tax=Pseudozyma flocculosa TaxID=84751 RepID=A0A5C3FBC4_9BASI|nr:uncharacterized protein PFL1_03431 [Pseudozyma flocculosa PF-1]EPQ29144.1 hypothetical protein PFL1_03431 [Pseudozyma flocculosa PF-1]SPO41560.1 uncharacterized protein PSFLO_07042 [Pseudozyma flocculosa]
MWCDNCLLIFPLKHGAIAWDVLIAVYNLAGSIILFQYGQFLFFNYPEWQIYGGIGMAVMAICVINIIGLSNSSYMFTRLCFFLWPFILIVVAVRAGLMIFQLDRQQSKIIWECNNGGQAWGTPQEGTTSTATMPSGFCSAGFHSLYIAFVLSLLVDFGLQVYAYFLCWRFMKRIEHYYAVATSDKHLYHL